MMVDIPENIDKETLAFPHARIVQMVRSKTRKGQFVRRSVYVGLNILLGKIAYEIIKEMVNTDRAYIEKSDLDKAAKKFESIEAILKEKERIVFHLRALKEDVEKLARDIEHVKV